VLELGEHDRGEPVLAADARQRLGIGTKAWRQILRRLALEPGQLASRERDASERQRHPGLPCATTPLSGEGRGQRRTQQHLTRRSSRLEVDRLRHWPARDDQLPPVVSSDQEHVELAGVDTDGHPQSRPAEPGRPDGTLHTCRRSGCAGGMVVSGEPDQQRVTAELQYVAALASRRVDQSGEAAVDHLGQSLRALLAAGGEPLGQGGEPGQVGRHERAGKAAVAQVGDCRKPA
jgi:hypothetical protein